MSEQKKLTPVKLQELLDYYEQLLNEERANPDNETETEAKRAAEARFKTDVGTTIEAVRALVEKEPTRSVQEQNILAELEAGTISRGEAVQISPWALADEMIKAATKQGDETKAKIYLAEAMIAMRQKQMEEEQRRMLEGLGGMG